MPTQYMKNKYREDVHSMCAVEWIGMVIDFQFQRSHLMPVIEQLKWSIKVVIFNYSRVTLSCCCLSLCMKCTVNTNENSVKRSSSLFYSRCVPIKGDYWLANIDPQTRCIKSNRRRCMMYRALVKVKSKASNASMTHGFSPSLAIVVRFLLLLSLSIASKWLKIHQSQTDWY